MAEAIAAVLNILKQILPSTHWTWYRQCLIGLLREDNKSDRKEASLILGNILYGHRAAILLYDDLKDWTTVSAQAVLSNLPFDLYPVYTSEQDMDTTRRYLSLMRAMGLVAQNLKGMAEQNPFASWTELLAQLEADEDAEMEALTNGMMATQMTSVPENLMEEFRRLGF